MRKLLIVLFALLCLAPAAAQPPYYTSDQIYNQWAQSGYTVNSTGAVAITGYHTAEQILNLWAASGFAVNITGASVSNIPAANITGILSPSQIGNGTASAGTYVDGGTGNWTALPAPTLTQIKAAWTGSKDSSHIVDGSGNARLLTSADIPSLSSTYDAAGAAATAQTAAQTYASNASNLSSGIVATAMLGTGTASSTTFLRGDGTWGTPSGSVSQANITAGTWTTDLTAGARNITTTGTLSAGTLTATAGAASSFQVGILSMTGTMSSSLNLGTQNIITSGNDTLVIPTGNSFNATVNGTSLLTLGVSDGGSTSQLNWGLGKFGTTGAASTDFGILQDLNDLFYSSSAAQHFYISGTQIFQVLSTGIKVLNGNIQVGTVTARIGNLLLQGGAATAGRVEVADRMSVMAAGTAGSYSDPGAGSLYLDGAISLGGATPNTGHFASIAVADSNGNDTNYVGLQAAPSVPSRGALLTVYGYQNPTRPGWVYSRSAGNAQGIFDFNDAYNSVDWLTADGLAVNITSTLGREVTFQSGSTAATAMRLMPTAVVLANSSTTTLFVATGHYGRVKIYDNTGQYGYYRIAATATPVLEGGSANFVVSASPTSAQLGLTVSGSNLNLVLGSAATTSVAAVYEGI